MDKDKFILGIQRVIAKNQPKIPSDNLCFFEKFLTLFVNTKKSISLPPQF